MTTPLSAEEIETLRQALAQLPPDPDPTSDAVSIVRDEWRWYVERLLATLDAARPSDDLTRDVERLQAELPEGWSVLVGYTVECSFCAGWWATASKRLEEPPYYPKVVSSETRRPRGQHHDTTLGDALRHLHAALAAEGIAG